MFYARHRGGPGPLRFSREALRRLSPAQLHTATTAVGLAITEPKALGPGCFPVIPVPKWMIDGPIDGLKSLNLDDWSEME